MRSVLVLALLLLTAPPLAGQDVRGFVWASPFTIAGGSENRMPVGNGSITDSIMTLDTPAFTYIRRSPRNSLTMSYEGEFEMFANHSQFNMWSHAAGFRDSYELSRRATFEFGDGFLSTQDPARWLTGATFLLPRSNLKENDGYLGLGYRISPVTSFDTRFDTTYASARQTGSIGPNLFDNRTYSQSASLSRLVAKTSRVSATYAYVRVDPLGPPPTPGISIIRNMHTVTVGYTYSRPDKFLVSIGAGALRTNTTSYTVEAHFERRMGPVRIRGDYGRQFAVYSIFGTSTNPSALVPGVATGLLPSAVVDTGVMEIAGHIGTRFGFDLRGTYANNNSTLIPQAIRSWIAQGRLDYRLTGGLSAFIGADLFRQNLTFPLGIPIDRNRYLGGIEFAISRPRRIAAETSALPMTNRLTNSLLIDDPLIAGPAARRKD